MMSNSSLQKESQIPDPNALALPQGPDDIFCKSSVHVCLCLCV